MGQLTVMPVVAVLAGGGGEGEGVTGGGGGVSTNPAAGPETGESASSREEQLVALSLTSKAGAESVAG